MKGKIPAIWLALLALLPANALGDGGFIPSTALEKVQIPDQRALIHFADGRETLVIDTAFKGEGTNFAWIIPVPSLPTLQPATTGLFSTLQVQFQPKIVHEISRFYLFAIFLGLLIAFLMWRYRRGESVFEILVFMAVMVLLAGLLLPALGSAGMASDSGSVKVIERKRVGVYETATLSSRNGEAVFEWLKANGFATPTNFIPAIRAYAQEGWYFVASKIPLDAALPEGANAHPLALTFKTQRPVYPLRLTGINNESCRIELYIFGQGRAEVRHFNVERCAQPSYPPQDARPNWRVSGVNIRHPLLRQLVDGSPVGTKSVGELSSRQMQSDAYIYWTPFQEKRLTRYSGHGAAIIAANVAVPMLMIGLLALLVGFWVRHDEPARAKRACTFSGRMALAAVICGVVIYACLPKVQVIASRRPAMQMNHLHQSLIPELYQYAARLRASKGERTKLDAAWVRHQLAENSDFRKSLGTSKQTNLISGQLWREEDSPGNYMIRQTTSGVDYVWYDIDGGENTMTIFDNSDEK